MQAATGNSLTSGLTPEGKTRPDDFGKKAQRPILGVSSSGWAKLARNLKAEIDENLIGAYCGRCLPSLRAGRAQTRDGQDLRRPGH